MASLDTYRQKRDFGITTEPRGKKRGNGGNAFVIQKHAARRLHYDFRLEMDGVLKSWAVTRGPSLVPTEKRLAVHVEDHPLEYGDFEGTIPKGEYGGGTVIIWDRGTWKPIGDAARGYAKGHLEFELAGKKLGGRWHLVRMQRKSGERQENWLLIKGDDDDARSADAPDILEERPESARTGRQLEDVAGEQPGWSASTGSIRRKRGTSPSKAKAADPGSVPDSDAMKGVTEAQLPDFIKPMLATLAPAPPTGDNWVHEIKFDGYRLQTRIEAGKARLLTRAGLDWTNKFGKRIVAALEGLPVDNALIDGELVVETAFGASDFSALQADLSEGRSDRFIYYAFDLLYLDGKDLRAMPLLERKRLLEQLLASAPPQLRFSSHFEEAGNLVLRHACRLSLEGVVSKLRDSAYRPGRGKSWIKSKCSARQEFVIGGYTPSTSSERMLGSLLLGVYDKGKLEHVGRVGTGFTAAVARELFARLEGLRTRSSPFHRKLTRDEARRARYVRPELVAEVEFRAWTADGNLRHASFRGLREDKPATEIVREIPRPQGFAPKPPQPAVRLTHPDRIYWPDVGVTKEGLADYYTEVWRHIAPHIVGRPLALLRAPSGITGQMFFQKHAWKGLNRHIRQVADPRSDEEAMLAIDDLDGLLGLVQSAVLEIHPWGTSLADWEHPDTIVMDLDPGEGASWQQVIAAARETAEHLRLAGLVPYVKTSGGKGLHVVAALQPKADWPTVKAYTKRIADAMAADSPEAYVSTITKSRRRGKVLIDYLRNQRGMTAIAPYSTRARPGAAVSMPLGWDELDPGIGPAHFSVENAPTRLSTLDQDPWANFRAEAVPLEPETSRKS